MAQEARQLGLIAEISDVMRHQRDLVAGYEVRPMNDADMTALAHLYFAAYSRDVVADMPAAREEIERTFAAEYGRLDAAASPVIVQREDLVASVMTVEEAPWPDTPPGPFVIELIVHPQHRRLGLAEFALQHAAQALVTQRKRTMALRVMSDNDAARALYEKLGFGPW